MKGNRVQLDLERLDNCWLWLLFYEINLNIYIFYLVFIDVLDFENGEIIFQPSGIGFSRVKAFATKVFPYSLNWSEYDKLYLHIFNIVWYHQNYQLDKQNFGKNSINLCDMSKNISKIVEHECDFFRFLFIKIFMQINFAPFWSQFLDKNN